MCRVEIGARIFIRFQTRDGNFNRYGAGVSIGQLAELKHSQMKFNVLRQVRLIEKVQQWNFKRPGPRISIGGEGKISRLRLQTQSGTFRLSNNRPISSV